MRTSLRIDRLPFRSFGRQCWNFLLPRPFVNLFANPFRRISLLLVGLVISAGVIGMLVLQFVKGALIERAGQSLELAAADAADKLDRHLVERYGDIQMMAHAFTAQIDNPTYLSAYLSRMREAYPFYMWLAVTDAEGKIVASTDAIWLGQDRRTTTWFQSVRTQRQIAVQEAQPYVETGGVRAVAFSAQLIDASGKFHGVVTSLVGIPTLADLFQQAQGVFRLHVGPQAQPEYIVVATNGEAIIDSIFHEEEAVNLAELVSVNRVMASNVPGYVAERTLRGQRKVITGYAKTRGYGTFTGLTWGILVRVDQNHVLG
ncbi:MAG: cache domain-containing protein, partial [Nitrospirales bacterium]|nr:cache domain-containing protein [Nitrospirales bacterium]